MELLEDYGFDPHLVHSSRCKAIASARLKNDKVDAAILAQLLRADLLPEAWIAPPPVRALRALLRHRVALVRVRTLLRNRIHAIVAEHGHDRPRGGYWTGPGRAWLTSLALPAVSREVVEDDLGLIDALQERIDRLDWEIHQRARSDPRVKVLTQFAAGFQAIAKRRGKKIATTAVARKLLTRAWHLLTDAEHVITQPAAAAAPQTGTR